MSKHVYRRPWDYAVREAARRRLNQPPGSANQPPVWSYPDPATIFTGTHYLQNLDDVCSDPNDSSALLTYSLVSGSFPTGLELVGSIIQGTPSEVGTFTVTLRADDGTGTTDEQVVFTTEQGPVFVPVLYQLTRHHTGVYA